MGSYSVNVDNVSDGAMYRSLSEDMVYENRESCEMACKKEESNENI